MQKSEKIMNFFKIPIDIREKTLYNGYNHRNGVMGRSV